MADSVITFVLDHLSQLVAHEANLLCGVGDKIRSLQLELEIINGLLDSSKSKKGIENTVVNQIRDEAHRAEDVIDTFVAKVAIYKRRSMLGKMLHGFGQATLLREVANEVDKIKTTLKEIRDNKDQYDAFKESNNPSAAEEEKEEKERAQSLNKLRINVEEEDVVGFVHDSKLVIKRVLEGGSNRKIVSIIGMGGLGKTTLARKVYNSNEVKQHFECRAWVYVSNECRVSELLRGLLKHLMPNFEQQYRNNKKDKKNTRDISSLSEEELKKLVWNSLESERYLVVVDDLWRRQDWDEVQDAFPNNNRGSRILITSRLKEVALHSGDDRPYYLEFLNEEESWELFCRKVFKGKDYPSDLEDLGKQMVQSCRGLPLSIIVLAGLLVNKEKSHIKWSKVVGHVNWHLTQDETKVKDIVLKLSYDNLPRRLKPCFLYLGLFPEDFEIPVAPLLRKWVAEGFIQDAGNRDPDDVAEDYLHELIDRCLVQVARVKRNGVVKKCQVHDLLRDLCISESKEDKVFQVSTENNFPIQKKPRRLSIHNEMSHYISSSNNDHSNIRSLFFFGPGTDWECLSKGFKLVRVLEFRLNSCLKIPSNLGNFIHLRYLRIEALFVRFIPASILNLWNLQTIDLDHWSGRKMDIEFPISFPVQMWKLKYLRHLNARGQPLELRGSLESGEKMWNVQTICFLVLNMQATYLITKGTFPNLKSIGLQVASGYEGELPKLLQSLQQSSHLNKLEIVFEERKHWEIQNEQLQNLGQFNCLTVLSIGNAFNLLICALTFPPNLTELKLFGIGRITDEGMNGLGNLTKLKILRLLGDTHYDGDFFDLNCVGGGFPQLEVFKMKSLVKVGKWKLENGTMPRLHSVIIKYCESLDDLPSKLWSLSGLRKLHIREPSRKLATMLWNLKIKNEVQIVVEHDKSLHKIILNKYS